MKKIIPNMLTILRILLTPVIIYLGIKELMVPLLILAIFVALTDFLDGKLARLWNVSTKLGAKLDAVGDKVLAIGLLIILVFHRHVFFYVLILESLMAIMNFCFYLRKGVVHSLLVGKLKTWIIFVTIFVGLLDIIFPRIYMPVSIFVFLTVVLQAVCIFKYIFFYFSIDKNVKKINFRGQKVL